MKNKYSKDTSSDQSQVSPNLSQINHVAPGFIGLDYYANQRAVPVGDKASFPSQPRGITAPTPQTILGPLIVTPALIEARDTGKGIEAWPTYINSEIIYANNYFRLMGPINDQKTKFLPVSVAYKDQKNIPTTVLLYNSNRETKVDIATNGFVEALSLSAANNLQLINIVGYEYDDTAKVYNNSGYYYIGKGLDKDGKVVDLQKPIMELIVDTYEACLLNACNFVFQTRMFQTFGHALIKKYPKYAPKIAILSSVMSKAAYRTVVNSIADSITNSYVNYIDWNLIVKYLSVPSSFGDGIDRPLLTQRVRFSTWDKFEGAVFDSAGKPVNATTISWDPETFMLESNFISDALEKYIFDDSIPASEKSASGFLDSNIRNWGAWAQAFRQTFLPLTIAIEYYQQTGNQFAWGTGWEFLPAWNAQSEFDAYMLVPDMYELAATSNMSYDVDKQTYTIDFWYNRNSMMPKLLADQGYFNLWPSQGALIAVAKTPSDKAISKLTMTGLISYYSWDHKKSPSIVYDPNRKCFIIDYNDAKSVMDIKTLSLWIDKMSEYIPTLCLVNAVSGGDVYWQRSSDLIKSKGFAQNIEAYLDVYHSHTASPFPITVAPVITSY